MLKRIRSPIRLSIRQLSFSKSKEEPVSGARKDSVTDAEPLTFFLLPAELRNEIYSLVATDTTLSIPLSKPKKGPPTPSLLLVSRQTQAEYLPILLSQATISILITTWDFNNLIRVLDAQSKLARSALAQNPTLKISIPLAHVPTRANREHILAWLRYQASNRVKPHAKLPFRYEAKFRAQMRPPRAANQYANRAQMKWDLLGGHVRMLLMLCKGDECKSPAIKAEATALVDDLRTRCEALKEESEERLRRRGSSISGLGVGIAG